MPEKARKTSTRSPTSRPGTSSSTTPDDDFIWKTIAEIQGTGHQSDLKNSKKRIKAQGVVTAIEGNGFYIQEHSQVPRKGASVGIFVAQESPKVRVGNLVAVVGRVREIRSNNQKEHLSSTQLTKPEVTIVKDKVPLPEPVELGTDEYPLPTGSIYEAGLFYERFEGMRVRLPESRVIGPSNQRGDIYVAIQTRPSGFAPHDGKSLWRAVQDAISTDGSSTAVKTVSAAVHQGRSIVWGALKASWASGKLQRPSKVRLTESFNTMIASLRSDDLPLGPDGTLRASPDRDHAGRLRISFDEQMYGVPPVCDVGDRLGPIDGIFHHDRGFYGIKPTHPLQVISNERKPTDGRLSATDEALTLATYNVENLDPCKERRSKVAPGILPDDDIGDGRFARIARQVVNRLHSPDIVALQEIEDNDGAEVSNETDASKTWNTLINNIVAAGGPEYRWIDHEPDHEGGRPGGNIRVGYLFNPQRVRLVASSVERVGAIATSGTHNPRKSLCATFEFLPTGNQLSTLVHHWASQRGSTPTYRDPNMPKVIAGEDERLKQNEAALKYIGEQLQKDSSIRLLSVGDFNATEHDVPVRAHGSQLLFNLGDLTPDHSRYSYIHEGLAIPLDHQFASEALRGKVEFEYVHINAGFAVQNRSSDHDPTLSRIDMR